MSHLWTRGVIRLARHPRWLGLPSDGVGAKGANTKAGMVRVNGRVWHVEEVLSGSGLWHPIGLGRKTASRIVFLTNAPKSSLGRPLANRIPGFFDLLTRQQDYLSYSACPLHLRYLCHPFNCAACRTFITPDASRPR